MAADPGSSVATAISVLTCHTHTRCTKWVVDFDHVVHSRVAVLCMVTCPWCDQSWDVKMSGIVIKSSPIV